MRWIADFWDLPMVWDIIIPVMVILLFALFLVWDSRLPPERRTLGKLINRKNKN